MKSCILPRSFYNRDTVVVAKELLGKKLVYNFVNNNHELSLVGVICETEAYTWQDPASHSFKGLTKRNAPMFGPVGHAYVYLSYGLHVCLNITARDSDNQLAGGVLIRAGIPQRGIDIMQKNRYDKPLNILTNGPGKVGQAFGITLGLNGVDMACQSSFLYVASGDNIDKKFIKATPRIGISVARDYLWRFIITSQGLEFYNFKL